LGDLFLAEPTPDKCSPETSGKPIMVFILPAKGGHNAESHNHNDVGPLLFYTLQGGKPALIDVWE